ncbi:hypothetical protein CVT20_03895 [Pseudomonas aeruginosa]|uniref:hypothetical protein n=1 Tax=Pseudomonas aeruginosa TaxID=287 RepID=UPI00089DD3C3|nr:hypothetical protein [Pseudomonas aeruginosa]PKG14198.1 hypothetical protein CVT20_03895 [Pseudomonas aeruginosa]
MREEFEAWHHAEFGYVIAVEDDPEQDGQCAKRWKAWQASRAALRVELPDDGIEDCRRDWANSCRDNFDTGYCYATDRITQALQQAGIEVRNA